MKGKVGEYRNKIFLVENFRSMLHGLLPFCPPVSLTELCSCMVWFERSPHKLHKLADKVALVKPRTSQAIEGT